MKKHPKYDPFHAPKGFNPILFRILLWKKYFDTGLALTTYFKYLIAFFGLASQNIGTTMWIAVAYGCACQVLGCLWHRTDLVRLELEIHNSFNDFVKEMRDKITKK